MRPPTAWPSADLLAERASRTPGREALVAADTGAAWTYRELHAAVDGLAGRLDPHLGDGRLGVLSPTRPAVAQLLFAAFRLGVPLVPLNHRNATDDLADQADRADLDALVCTVATRAAADEVAPDGCVVASVDDEDGPAWVDESGRSDERDALCPPDPDCSADAEALLVFTSGTTGRPKGVRLTVENLVASATASAFRLGVDRDDRWLVPLPTCHVGGLAPLVRSTLYGTTTVLGPGGGFDPETTARHLAEQRCTCVSLVPTMLDRLLEFGWTPNDRLRVVLLGGAPASEGLLDRCAERAVPAWPTYGMSEAASQVTTAPPAMAREHPGTVGQPLVNVTLRVLDADGEPCAPGERGELVVDGPQVMRGYLDDEHTDAAVSERGLHTGDVGYRDGDGRLWVTGRLDDLLVSGGENVDPNRVARVLVECPGVRDVAVVGLDDPEWGDRVAALVVGECSPDTFDGYARDHLADHERPRTVAFADALPRTASGTVDRDAVRARLRSDGR
ncbi:class I adenylate-forming enzyme family protein [Haloarchaeobius iranensis]|uniref:O-succinylbenzoic acid--CoA ligase n=1 Tax=Haloarchaeobius iranensis TaxID=996166 RepID=A0A1G9SWP3_9EURY|nr:class I adenylate-forming enzyme family protein [Haloarchaeobius iranensis]SDM39840.1 O-succinylbenzoic acid--CoA ligase [Haloarchaeobius iranensis]